MSDKRIAFAYIPTPSLTEARAIATVLIEKKLASCCNIIGPMESMFVWQGKFEHQETEVLMLVKTDERLKEAVTEEVLQQHSYDTPSIIFFDGEAMHPGYFEWHRSSLIPE